MTAMVDRCPVCNGPAHYDVHRGPEPSRYELLHEDERFGLHKGDVVICEPMHPAWADEKVAVIRRESDGFEPGCSQYRSSIRHLSGPRS